MRNWPPAYCLSKQAEEQSRLLEHRCWHPNASRRRCSLFRTALPCLEGWGFLVSLASVQFMTAPDADIKTFLTFMSVGSGRHRLRNPALISCPNEETDWDISDQASPASQSIPLGKLYRLLWIINLVFYFITLWYADCSLIQYSSPQNQVEPSQRSFDPLFPLLEISCTETLYKGTELNVLECSLQCCLYC